MILHVKKSALSCYAAVLVIMNVWHFYNLSLSVNNNNKVDRFFFKPLSKYSSNEEPCGKNANQKLDNLDLVGISYDGLFSSNATGIKVNSSFPTDPPPEQMWLQSRLVVEEDNMNNSTIPMKIHKIYIQKDGEMQDLTEMSPNLRAAHKSWRDLNPGYDMQYFDLHACRKYLALHFHPVFLRSFDCLEAFACKADFMRLLVVYKEGGW